VATAYIRATDSDRNNVCQTLDTALGEGQLSMQEHRERVSAATQATTLGDLQVLVADLQIRRAPVKIPQLTVRARRRLIRFSVAAVVTVVVLVGGGMAWAIFGDNPAPSQPAKPPAVGAPSVAGVSPAPTAPAAIPPTTAAQPPASLLSLRGVTGVLAQMRAKFGNTLGYELSIYPGYAVVDRPDTANANDAVMWFYGGGAWSTIGPGIATPLSTVGDLGAFDVQAVVGVAQDAPQTLQLPDANTTYLVIESRKEGGLHLSVHSADAGRSGSIVVGTDGAITSVVPPG
jgi:uncharacterized protein DUF1707